MGPGCGGTTELGPYLFLQCHVALMVHLVLGVASAGSFAGTKLNVDIHLTEETQSWAYASCLANECVCTQRF